jgi:chorismate mutase/prephenate dehydratase
MSQKRRSGDKTTEKETGIPALRRDINRVDEELLSLLARRRGLSQEMARAKAQGSSIRDPKREEELLVRLIRAGREAGLDAHFVTKVFHEIIDDSIRLQQEYLQKLANRDGEPEVIRVAFQGIEGAYSQLAAKEFFSEYDDRLAYLGLTSFTEVVQAVEQGRADYAMLPIENTTSGGINEVYDLLLHTRLLIVAEKKYRVRHCLIASSDVPMASLRRIYSHPQAVAQCSDFLAGLSQCQVEYFTDTAMSVSRIKDEGNPSQAAIASEASAENFGLHVLKRDLANQAENFTRFLIVARTPREVDLRIPCKTSLVMATGQKAGSLVEALLVFRNNGLNLAKLESRPILGNPWEEMFYVDFDGNIADPGVREALDELARVTRFIKVLGSFPSQDLPRTSLPPATVAAAQPRRKGTAATDDAAAEQSTAAPAKPTKPSGYRLASREHKPEDTVVEIKGVKLGGSSFAIIAGPCSVESREQIMACAREVKEQGGVVLRGGCFKPRTSPYSFQGLGYEGLEYLVEAGTAYGLPVITEVLSTEDVVKVAETSDMLQIGARNMQNFTLLGEVGRVNRPVMLKRGLMSSLDELLHAAEYILAGGNQQVILCERGIRTFETATRNTLDLSAVPILRARTHLPVIVDPSHAAGDRELVAPLARAAKAVGAQGIMVEIHPEPEKAMSDGPQALRFPQFKALAGELLG